MMYMGLVSVNNYGNVPTCYFGYFNTVLYHWRHSNFSIQLVVLPNPELKWKSAMDHSSLLV